MRAECVQGEGGGQKRPKNCVRTLCMAPYHNIYLFTLLTISIPSFSGKIEVFDSWQQEVWIRLLNLQEEGQIV